MNTALTPSQALELVKRYNKEAFHVQHALTVGAVMRYFAEEEYAPQEADFWEVVGILHDIDFEMYPDEHCTKAVELLKEAGAEDTVIHAVCSHGFGGTATTCEPELPMEKVLFAVDELTGLIGAAALMRPSKSCLDMELKSLKKKYKDKKFAAGCSREIIAQGAEMFGIPLEELQQKTLDAMKQSEETIAQKMN